MGCTPSKSTGDVGHAKQVFAVGQTERQMSKAHQDSMTSDKARKQEGKVSASEGKELLDHQGFLLPEELARRTFSSITNREVTLGTPDNVTQVQFATWTQRGYYPDDPDKMNQDECGTHTNFAGVKTDAMFAVYDGHGKEGRSCAQFAKEKLPKSLAKHIRKVRCQRYQSKLKQENPKGKKKGFDPDNWPMLDKHDYEKCCVKAFLEVNQTMHDDPSVTDNLSGTTATTVCFHGDLVCIGNVGDSRAVLGHRVKGNVTSKRGVSIYYPNRATDEEEKDEEANEFGDDDRNTEGVSAFKPRAAPSGTSLLAIPVSKDQTPYRKDERERVMKQGASIMSIDQMQGKEELHDNWGDIVHGETIDTEGDSPRVWVDGKDYPGCAFTRSLGDSVSEDIGVTADPELLTTELTINDEFLVIASDGIFEFLTNQAVIDMCAASETPLEACEKIVRQAYQQWLTYEKRTDDITIIVCFLQNLRMPPTDGIEETSESLINVPNTIYGIKPGEGESSSKDHIPGGILKKEGLIGEGSTHSVEEVVLTATPAPPMAFADIDNDDADYEVNFKTILQEAHIGSHSKPPGDKEVGFKDDTVTTEESPESDSSPESVCGGLEMEMSRSKIRV